MRLYHRTTSESALAIVRSGFRDATEGYLTLNKYTGVWLSNVPLGANDGVNGDTVITLELPVALIRRYEWIEEQSGHREFLIPAALVNSRGRIINVNYEEL